MRASVLLFAAMACFAQTSDPAAQLYEEGQQRVRDGRYDTARVTFQTLIAVYPQSPFARQAAIAIRESLETERARSIRLTVRSVHIRKTGRLSEREIRRSFDECEVRLAPGRPYDPRDVEQARAALAEILVANGIAQPQIKTEARAIRRHSVAVILTVIPPK